MSVEIVGPFKQRELVIDGWRVPLIQAVEQDGGQVALTLDSRIGITVDAKHFEQVARFVADVIGTCWGYGAHPRDDTFDRSTLARVPHPSLAPARIHMVGAIGGEGTNDGS